MIINITQFHRPYGRTTEERTEVPDDCAVGYEAMRRHACRLTAESFFNNVSLCIEHEEGDYDMEIVPNGPQVQEAIAKMLRSFDATKFELWLKEIA